MCVVAKVAFAFELATRRETLFSDSKTMFETTLIDPVSDFSFLLLMFHFPEMLGDSFPSLIKLLKT